MTEFDLIVVGGGSGTRVSDAAAERGMDVAVVEPGPLGGACVTRGCVPSKALIHRADLIEHIRSADAFGIDAELGDVDFEGIVEEIHDAVYGKAERMEQALRESDQTFYDAEARFVDERTLALESGDDGARDGPADDEITGERIVVAAGARPTEPPIDGLDDVEYLTSTDALWLDEQPDSLAIVGGGYIGAELGHFYGQLGTDVTIIGRSDVLVDGEDRDVSETVTEAFEERYDVYTGHEAAAVEEDGDGVVVTAEPSDGEDSADGDGQIQVQADEVLVAAGRRPNTDRLDVEAAGIETDDAGFVETDEYLETTVDGVWALGDVAGPPLFKHAADYEARCVAMNVLGDDRWEVDYTGLAHAIFTSPQVAGVGDTEGELEEADRDYESARFAYADAPMGLVSKEERGFVKVLADPGDGEILGCHVVGSQASTLIHEVAMAMRKGSGTVDDVAEAIHVHPALNEVVLGAFDQLADVPFTGPPDWSDAAMGGSAVTDDGTPE